ncbi:MAG: chromate transporter [Chloroflexia bacterium]
MDALTFFWLFLKASLFSTGGMGNLPILHEDLLGRGWATEQNFAEALAVGQISPGPNGLWVISLGYLTAGWLGSALACIAITIPPMLIVFIDLCTAAWRTAGRLRASRAGWRSQSPACSSSCYGDLETTASTRPC